MSLSKLAKNESGKDQYNFLFLGEVPESLWIDTGCDVDIFEKVIRSSYVEQSADPKTFRSNQVMDISARTYFGSILWQFMFFLGNISFILIPLSIYFIPRIGIILFLIFMIMWIQIKIKWGRTWMWTTQERLELMYRDPNFLKQIKYFSMKYVWPTSLKKTSGPRIFALMPHGIVPYSLESLLFFRMIFGRIPKIAVANVLFKIPILRDINLIRGVSSSRDGINKGLVDDDVIIVCDGIAGMFEVNGGKGNERVVTPRYGVAKLALEHGATIIPCYGFGHNHIHSVITDPFGCLASISHLLGMSITPYFGLYGLPIGRRLPIMLAFGEAITSKKVVKPSRDAIQQLHTELLANLTRTFDTHKHAFGWSDKELVFV